MQERELPKLTLIEASQLGQQVVDLMTRVNAGEEIVLTLEGKPTAFIASSKIMPSLSSCGLMTFELPPEMGGYWWLSDEKATAAYERQIAGNIETPQIR